jgi:hypothetical protein
MSDCRSFMKHVLIEAYEIVKKLANSNYKLVNQMPKSRVRSGHGKDSLFKKEMHAILPRHIPSCITEEKLMAYKPLELSTEITLGYGLS